MAIGIINVLLSSFPGLGLPPTLSLPTRASIPIADFNNQLRDRLPSINSRVTLTTTANRTVSSSSSAPISSLLATEHDILPLRLTVPLCGGKGGFGSQLRAAGGRMSSRRKKNAGENNSSNRNLDGRRLRTVNEAKALAEYLALKPDMEKKEKEARRKRWEQVVEMAERREEEIRSGNKGKVDGKWMEDKEEAGERAREAVRAAMRAGNYHDNLGGAPGERLEDNEGKGSSVADGSEEMGTLRLSKGKQDSATDAGQAPSRVLFGFDEDDGLISDVSQETEAENVTMDPAVLDTKASRRSTSVGEGNARL